MGDLSITAYTAPFRTISSGATLGHIHIGINVVNQVLGDAPDPLLDRRVDAPALLVAHLMDFCHGDGARQDDRPDVGADTAQVFQCFDRPDHSRGDPEERD
jgi:hypothetical protein